MAHPLNINRKHDMDKIDTTCESIRLRLIAAAIGLRQCTKTAANVVPLPGTESVVVIGTPAEVMELLPGAGTAQPRKLTQQQLAEAGRVLADRNADACGVDREDNWKIYGNDFIEDARAVLAAVAVGVEGATG